MNSPGLTTSSVNRKQVLADHEEYLFPCVSTLYKEPLLIAEASGITVIDEDGKEYLDFFGGVLTTSIGHCHPTVVERVQEQVARLGHTSTLYATENQTRVAKKIAQLAPGGLSQSFFTNSGSEAIETAIMLARAYTGRTEIVALRHGYSGRTALAHDVTAHSTWHTVPSSSAGITHAVAPYQYRCPFEGASQQECEDYFIQDLEDTIRTTTTGKPAAFLAETIMGVGGFIVPPPGYFKRAAELIRDVGGLFICDEVQAGWGRTGQKWFGIEHWGVTPDVMTMAKGIANGFPVGATTTTPEIAAGWKGKTFSTYGGNPISMAATEATIDVMMEEDVPTRSAVRGAQLRIALESLQANYDFIGDVRGMGLMQCLEIVEDPKTKKPAPELAALLVEEARSNGLLLGFGGLHGNVIRIGPPMLVSENEMAQALERLGVACAAIQNGKK